MVWFGNVIKREDSEGVRTVMKLSVEGRRERGKPKKKWLNGIESDVRTESVYVNDMEDRVMWRLRINVSDHK